MIRLEKLHIHKLGNVAPDTQLHFSEQGALLLGKNGTGKTTLLNIIVFAICSDWAALQTMSEDGFDIEYELYCEGSELAPSLRLCVRMHDRSSIRTGHPDFESFGPVHDTHFECSVFDREGALHLHVSTKGNKTNLTGADGRTTSRAIAVESPATALLFGDDQGFFHFEPSAQLGLALYRLVGRLRRYDEALEFYDLLTHSRPEPEPIASFFRPFPDANVGFRSAVLSTGTCQLLSNAFTIAEEAPEQLRFESNQHKLPWITLFLEHTGINKLTFTLDLISSKVSSNTLIAEYGPLVLRYISHGRTLRGHQLSFGQKRLLSLLHYLDAQESIVLADELVNGLHHEWIEKSIRLLDRKQAFLSSQNPLLFDFMNFSSAEEAASRFIECSLDSQGRFIWRNMPIDDAAEFFAVYETGIQHVSEILQTRGYW